MGGGGPAVAAGDAGERGEREDEAPPARRHRRRARFAYLIESSSMSNTSMPLGAPGRGELS